MFPRVRFLLACVCMVGEKKRLDYDFQSICVFVWFSPFLNNLDQMIAGATMEGECEKEKKGG